MAELSEAHKETIVKLLGCFKRPAEVSEIMRDEFEIEVSVSQVRKYDPTNPAFEARRDKFEPIFNAARQAYIEDVKAVPAANQAFRLNELQDLYRKAKKAKNMKLAADLLEQIAREVGGVLTNSRELNINDGRRARDMAPEDRAAHLGALLAEAIEQKRAEQPTKH